MGTFFFIILLGILAIVAGALLLVGFVIGIAALAKTSTSKPVRPPNCLPSVPPIGKRVQIKKGAMKGRFGTVAAREGASIVLEDKAGRRVAVPISDF